jgi:hypothetical protein
MDDSPPGLLGTARTDAPLGDVCAGNSSRTPPTPAESAMVDCVSVLAALRRAPKSAPQTRRAIWNEERAQRGTSEHATSEDRASGRVEAAREAL